MFLTSGTEAVALFFFHLLGLFWGGNEENYTNLICWKLLKHNIAIGFMTTLYLRVLVLQFLITTLKSVGIKAE